ncbi:MAG: HPr family phosphocarrier protein [Anaerolineales bacterium]|jgi:phosphotransferase system HPr (HPr) family protein
MKTSQIVVLNPVGLHARPAALFVKLASEFTCEILLCNLSSAGNWVNAKSILGLLSSGVKQGDRIEIKAEGTDEDIAVEALEALIRSDFREADNGGS